MTEYKKPKLYGKDEDGEYLGRIEQIITGRPILIFGKSFGRETGDTLQICNRHTSLLSFLWLFSKTSYRQIGTFQVDYPHAFYIGQDVIVVKKDNKIVEVRA